MIHYNIGNDAIAVVTFDHPDEPLNIISFQAFLRLGEVLDELAAKDDPRPVGVVFISGKADNFIVGVDIKDFLGFEAAEQATEASRQGQRILGKIARLSFPSVAAINGTCLGCGLELALNCTGRIITDHPRTVLGLPEVKLGLLPGTGGTQRLPRQVGLSSALDIMLTGKNVYPYKARKIGLVDEIVSSGVLLEAAKKRVLQLAHNEKQPARRKQPLATRALDGPFKQLVYRAARQRVLAQTSGNYPAPLEILKVVRKSPGRSLARGLEREAEGFGRLAMTPEHRALTHVYFASRASKTALKAEPQEVRQVGILGSGLMGSGIATVCLDRGLTVRQKDLSLDALAGSRTHIQGYFNDRVRRHIISRREAGLILNHYSATTDYSGFRPAQMVIEAVFEDLDLKRKIVAELEEHCPPETVIATGTSSMPITKIAEGARHPERIIGMHFFSPVERMPLLEIITSDYTDGQTLATAVELGRRLGKTVIVVKDSPGFYINRILTPYLNEAFKLLEDGLSVDDLDHFAQRMGFPVGPCTLLDEVGLDVADKVAEVMIAFFGERVEPTDHNLRFMQDDRLGRKKGRGFYIYEGGKRGKSDKTIYQLLDNPQRRNIPYEEVRDRLLSAILNEAAYALAEGLIEDASAGDIGAIFGFGFPPFLGGPYWAMDQIGLVPFTEQLQQLAERHGSRFTPAPGLLQRAEAGELYYPSS
ncbi:MAG: enoyl-CoA hydratase/isomerase family protein [Fidelibacterota bacterium]|nr:MAG: enoyl-CoA hydratase/isomerase family protein [Candidatus Neomarinimicrobiota bacterium]